VLYNFRASHALCIGRFWPWRSIGDDNERRRHRNGGSFFEGVNSTIPFLVWPKEDQILPVANPRHQFESEQMSL
jgi:hypothetical protein